MATETITQIELYPRSYVGWSTYPRQDNSATVPTNPYPLITDSSLVYVNAGSPPARGYFRHNDPSTADDYVTWTGDICRITKIIVYAYSATNLPNSTGGTIHAHVGIKVDDNPYVFSDETDVTLTQTYAAANRGEAYTFTFQTSKDLILRSGSTIRVCWGGQYDKTPYANDGYLHYMQDKSIASGWDANGIPYRVKIVTVPASHIYKRVNGEWVPIFGHKRSGGQWTDDATAFKRDGGSW